MDVDIMRREDSAMANELNFWNPYWKPQTLGNLYETWVRLNSRFEFIIGRLRWDDWSLVLAICKQSFYNYCDIMHERCPHSHKRKQLSLSVLKLHWFCTKASHSRFLVLHLLPREGVVKYCSLKTTSLEGILYSASGSSNWFFCSQSPWNLTFD